MAFNFTRVTQTIDPATQRPTSVTRTILGTGVQITKGRNPIRYRDLGLQMSQAPTILWAPVTYDATPEDVPEPGDTTVFRSRTWVVRDVEPTAPDGVFITGKVIISR